MAEVKVDLGVRSYTINIQADCINNLGKVLVNLAAGPKVMLVTDDNVFKLYGPAVLNILKQAGFSAEVCCVEPGETSKSLKVAESLYTAAIQMELDRSCAIVALGGGVVGDLAGFVAATYLRGVKFVQIPTSLLAQVDSSVGGKVAVNHQLGKNLIGAFYQPHAVLIDPKFLFSLPLKEFVSGMAEVIKYGIIRDEKFFDYLAYDHKKILNYDIESVEYIIKRCCEIKADIVSNDECEEGLRMILNFGHTIAHAVEKASNHQYTHGEAVAIGMYGAGMLSAAKENCSYKDVEKIKALLVAYKLPLKAEALDKQTLFSYIRHDKKILQGKINWIILRQIGQVFIDNTIEPQQIEAALDKLT